MLNLDTPIEKITSVGKKIARSKWKKKLITESIIADSTGQIKAIWFNQSYLIQNLKPGDQVFISGKVDYSRDEGLQFVHPNYEKITRNKASTTHTARIVPVYSLTKNITIKQIRYLMSQVIGLSQQIKEWLPQDIVEANKLLTLSESLKQIHFPDNKIALNQALDRLKFNELFLIQLHSCLARRELKQSSSFNIKFFEEETKQFVESLPFKLTDAQRKSAWEILLDLEKETPMNRLLEGDVGSGKTIVACLAILNTVLNRKQAALMAPTEILAKQHFDNICQLFKDWPIQIGLLTNSLQQTNKIQKHKKTESTKTLSKTTTSADEKTSQDVNSDNNSITKKEMYQLITDGELDLVIGTQALIQDKVNFTDLGLIIVDEQHRFGVGQRKKLKQKTQNYRNHKNTKSQSYTEATAGKANINNEKMEHDNKRLNLKSEILILKSKIPHLLSMTATPIPRSLALTVYGDLDLSVINQKPGGRKEIETRVVMPEERPKTYQFILSEIKKGQQIFIICPLIDPSDKLGTRAVKDEYKKLNEKIFPEISIGLLHGKLKPAGKEKVMREFLEQKTKILVATPVIEVGIDIPNATVMMIESAERFGLAQLHQFRGRVGRSDKQSYCFLLTESETESTIKRLQVMVESNDGFKIAERDLEFRGPGEVYGIKQSGFNDRLKVAKLTDYLIIKQSKRSVDQLLTQDPGLNNYPLVSQELKKFNEDIHFE